MIEAMNDSQEILDQQAGDLVEEALYSLPMQPPPPMLFTNVMAQVRAQSPKPVELPVFRLSWMDFALSLFFAGMIGVVMLVSICLPPVVRMNLDWQLRWFQVMEFDWALAAGLALAAAACCLAAVLFAGWQVFWGMGQRR